VDRVYGFRKEIAVSATSDSGSERIWRGQGGGFHRHIAQKMAALLAGDAGAAVSTSGDVSGTTLPRLGEGSSVPGGGADGTIPAPFPYLSQFARASLDAGRTDAREWGLPKEALICGAVDNGAEAAPGAAVDDAADMRESAAAGASFGGARSAEYAREFFLFPWEGSAGMRTIDVFLHDRAVRQKCKIVRSSWDDGIYFSIGTKLDEKAFRSALISSLRSFSLSAAAIDPAYTDKYDYLLPRELLAKQYAANMLESGALERLEKSLT
jgi:hypothetical protein